MRALFSIADWMAVAPGRSAKRDWIRWSGVSAEIPDLPEGSAPALPSLLRRRVSSVGQSAFAAALGALGERGSTRFLFASRHGEFGRTLGLLTALASDEPLSPAEFSLSVHNALAGLLSIAQRNGAGHTTIAAGPDTFVSALIEAAAGLASGAEEAVLVVYYDEKLPPPYDAFEPEGDGPFALALLLVPSQPGAERIALTAQPAWQADVPPTGAQARDFLRFYLSGALEGAAPGTDRLWQWRRDPA